MLLLDFPVQSIFYILITRRTDYCQFAIFSLCTFINCYSFGFFFMFLGQHPFFLVREPTLNPPNIKALEEIENCMKMSPQILLNFNPKLRCSFSIFNQKHSGVCFQRTKQRTACLLSASCSPAKCFVH